MGVIAILLLAVADVRLPYSIAAAERIASPCKLAIGDRPAVEVKVPARGELLVPPGQVRVTVDCGGEYSSEPVVVEAREGQSLQLNVVALPRISGRIISPQDAALLAFVLDDQGHLLGRPQADGSFRIPVPAEHWPHSVSVSAPGYGPVVMDLPSQPSAIELPDVQLKKAARLKIPKPLQTVEAVDIFKFEGKRQRTPYRTVSVQALRQNKFAIEVAPGNYLVVVRGAGPLERFGTTVEVAAGDEQELPLDPDIQEVDIRTFIGERTLGSAELMIESVDGLWNTTFRTSEEGTAKLRIWQPGEVVFILQSGGDVGSSGTLELRPPRVDIRVPDRTIEGKVVDASTGEGLGGVHINLSGVSGGTVTESAPDGTFRFIGVKPGTYTIAAGGANGLSRESVTVPVHEDVGVRQVRLSLRRQQEFALEIVTWNGQPANGAAVLELSGMNFGEADQAGTVRLPFAGGVARSVVVIASDGTWFAQSLPAVDPQSRVRITIPPPNSVITISAETNTDRAPIAGVSLVMRFNGVLFSSEALQMLRARAGVLLTSGEDGQIRLLRAPAGMYEFWPIRSRSDVQALLTGQLPAAPVVIAAGPGPNAARLSFSAVSDP